MKKDFVTIQMTGNIIQTHRKNGTYSALREGPLPHH